MKRPFCAQFYDCIVQFFGRKTAFCGFSADIYLQKNILTNTALLGFLGDSLAEMNRADRLNQRNLADQVLDLIVTTNRREFYADKS